MGRLIFVFISTLERLNWNLRPNIWKLLFHWQIWQMWENWNQQGFGCGEKKDEIVATKTIFEQADRETRDSNIFLLTALFTLKNVALVTFFSVLGACGAINLIAVVFVAVKRIFPDFSPLSLIYFLSPLLYLVRTELFDPMLLPPLCLSIHSSSVTREVECRLRWWLE